MAKIIRLTESDLNQVVKKVISEQTVRDSYPPITLDLIKKYIMTSLKNYDVSSSRTRRRLDSEIDRLAKEYYDIFIYRLVYMSEDDNWQEFLMNIEY